MKSNTIIFLFALTEVFFLVFASAGLGMGLFISPCFFAMIPIGIFFAWASQKLFEDWSQWHSLCTAVKDKIAENPHFKKDVEWLES